MNKNLYAPAAGLIAATAILGFAVASPMSPANSREQALAAAQISATDLSSRIYCYSGLTGTPNNLSRGWVCQRETGSQQQR